jgi:triosephosphate isomerase
LQTPILIVNAKNYLSTSGVGAIKLAESAETVAKELSINIAIAPPLLSLGQVVESVSINVLAQHCDSNNVGSSTGSIIPEMIKSFGGTGSLINHSEKRLSLDEIRKIVPRLSEVGLVSIVCAQSSEEVSSIAEIGPEFIAIEPPELIGSGIAVSTAKPEVITESIEAARSVNSRVKVICGAGIVTGKDVKESVRLGSVGVLVASGIIKSPNWYVKIKELASPLKE